jgi:hypothetical protein
MRTLGKYMSADTLNRDAEESDRDYASQQKDGEKVVITHETNKKSIFNNNDEFRPDPKQIIDVSLKLLASGEVRKILMVDPELLLDVIRYPASPPQIDENMLLAKAVQMAIKLIKTSYL